MNPSSEVSWSVSVSTISVKSRLAASFCGAAVVTGTCALKSSLGGGRVVVEVDVVEVSLGGILILTLRVTAFAGACAGGDGVDGLLTEGGLGSSYTEFRAGLAA